MGGRGSSLRPSAGGGGGGGNFSPFGVGDKIPDVGGLKEAIGEKGKPYSVENALRETNPNYNGTYSEYTENCQRCVVTYELRRRGYDVTALPTYEGDTLPQVVAGRNGRWQMGFQGAKRVSVGSRSAKKTQENLENEMRSYGNGSRGVVAIPGHVFNVENKNGRIIYVDAQIGKSYTSRNVFSNMTSSQTQRISLIRTDNLRISDRARNLVTLRK